MADMKKMIQEVFSDIADGLETGSFGSKVSIGITTLGSEISPDTLFDAAIQYALSHPEVNVTLIGPKRECDVKNISFAQAEDEDQQHKVMEELLDNGTISACVTQHYNFPVGVSTVGRVVTPGLGKEMAIANTTGTSAAHRVEAMVRNAIGGIIAAKSMGVLEPTVGILNVDGARKVEQTLLKLNDAGYPIHFAQSGRADGGAVMRGNDLIVGTPDIMVTDSLTGNLLMKLFSSFQSGGTYETTGYGYGPGIGQGYHRMILILSRVSGAPVIMNALSYAEKIVRNNIAKISEEEYKLANEAGLEKILKELVEKDAPKAQEEDIKEPPSEIVTASIAGIDIMELENAVRALWKNQIYAQSGMGCTGPIVLVSEANLQKATEILGNEGYVTVEREVC